MDHHHTRGPDRKPAVLERLRDRLRLKHYSIRTEHAYVEWAYRYLRFHAWRYPAQLAAPEVEAFLTHLAVEGNVAASTQIASGRFT